ncbi:MAG: hypothetical protein IKY74_02340 [Alistipes sp.]|nr:hypothetical protein [Alistipes sp.]
MKGYLVKISCDFEEFWRYNLVVMGSVLSGGEQSELIKYRSDVAAVGDNLLAKPEDYDEGRSRVELRSTEGVDADALTLYIYIIPHTLPRTEIVSETKDFEFRVEVLHDDSRVYAHTFEVNQWSGDNIVIRVAE